MKSGSLPYVPAVDGLRGLAVVMVVCAHAVPNLLVGRIGVDAFFVLSGYLITTILLAEWRSRGRIDLKAFYMRRLLRLAPPLAVVLTAYVAATPLWLSQGVSLPQLYIVWLTSITYTWNLLIVALGELPGGVLGALSHLWSLAQEEQFYLVFPLALVVALRRRVGARALMWALVGIGVAMLIAYVVTAPSVFAEFSPVTRGFGLLAGCVLAVGRWGWAGFRFGASTAWAAVLGLACVIAAIGARWLPIDADIPTAVLAFFVITAHVSTAPDSTLSRVLGRKSMVWLGLVSYSLYLWHLPLLVLTHEVFGMSALASALAAIPAALLLAELTRRYVESPMARVKERWVRSGTALEPSSPLSPAPHE